MNRQQYAAIRTGIPIDTTEEAEKAYEKYHRRYTAIMSVPGVAFATQWIIPFMRGGARRKFLAYTEGVTDKIDISLPDFIGVGGYLGLKALTSTGKIYRSRLERERNIQAGLPGLISQYISTASALDFLIRAPFFTSQLLAGGLLKSSNPLVHGLGNVFAHIGAHTPSSIFMRLAGSPMTYVGSLPFRLLGLDKLGSAALHTVTGGIQSTAQFLSQHNMNLLAKGVGLLGTGISTIGSMGSFMLPYMLANIGLSMWKARKLAKLRGQEPIDVSRYSVSSMVDSYVQQGVAQGQISFADQIKIQLLQAIERHTCIIPPWYQEWHNKYKATVHDYKTRVAGREGEEVSPLEKTTEFLSDLQDRLNEISLRFNPLLQITNLLLTGKTPLSTLRALREEREFRKRVKEAKQAFGITASQARLLMTPGSQLIQAVPESAKEISLMTASYDLQRFILSELVAIRKYGFGLASTTIYAEEKKSIFQRIKDFFHDALMSVPGLAALVEMYKLWKKGIDVIFKLPSYLRTGWIRFTDKLFGKFKVLAKSPKELLKEAKLELTEKDIQNAAYSFLAKHFPNMMQSIIHLEHRKVGLLEEIAEGVSTIADYLTRGTFSQRRQEIRALYQASAPEPLIWDVKTGEFLTLEDFKRVKKEREELLVRTLEETRRSTIGGRLGLWRFVASKERQRQTVQEALKEHFKYLEHTPGGLYIPQRLPAQPAVQRVTTYTTFQERKHIPGPPPVIPLGHEQEAVVPIFTTPRRERITVEKISIPTVIPLETESTGLTRPSVEPEVTRRRPRIFASVLDRFKEEQIEEEKKKQEDFRKALIAKLDTSVTELKKLEKQLKGIKSVSKKSGKDILKNLISLPLKFVQGILKNALTFGSLLAGPFIKGFGKLLRPLFSLLGKGLGNILGRIPGLDRVLSRIPGVGRIFRRIPGLGRIFGAGELIEEGAGLLGKVTGLFGKIGTKFLSKEALEAGLKFGLKRLPLVGLAAGALFGISKLLHGDFLGGLKEVASGALSMIPGIGTALSVGLDMISVDTIKKIFGKIKDFFGSIFSGIKDIIKPLLMIVSPVTGVLTFGFDLLKKGFGKIKDFFGSLFEGITKIVKWFNPITVVSETVKKILSFDIIKDTFGKIKSFFSKVIEGVKDFFKGIITHVLDIVKAITPINLAKKGYEFISGGIQRVKSFFTGLFGGDKATTARVAETTVRAAGPVGFAASAIHKTVSSIRSFFSNLFSSETKTTATETTQAQKEIEKDELRVLVLSHIPPVARRYGLDPEKLKRFILQTPEGWRYIEDAYSRYGKLRGIHVGVIRAALAMKKGDLTKELSHPIYRPPTRTAQAVQRVSEPEERGPGFLARLRQAGHRIESFFERIFTPTPAHAAVTRVTATGPRIEIPQGTGSTKGLNFDGKPKHPVRNVKPYIPIVYNVAREYGEDFAKVLIGTLYYEGVYTPPGYQGDVEAFMGISRRANPDWEGWKYVDRGDFVTAAKLIPKLYYNKYWKKLHLGELDNFTLKYYIFDTAVNMGIGRARQFLRQVGGIDILKTKEGFQKLRQIRIAYYHKLGKKTPQFLEGWLRRERAVAGFDETKVEQILAESRVQPTPVQPVKPTKKTLADEEIRRLVLSHIPPVARRYGLSQEELKKFILDTKEGWKFVKDAYNEFGGLRGVHVGVMKAALALKRGEYNVDELLRREGKKIGTVLARRTTPVETPTQSAVINVVRPPDVIAREEAAKRAQEALVVRQEQRARETVAQRTTPQPVVIQPTTGTIQAPEKITTDFEEKILEAYPKFFVAKSIDYILGSTQE